MINSSLTTLKILYYLQTESSPEEAVTTADILEYLKTQGIQADRRFVYKTIDNLIETGYPIQKVHSNYTYACYYAPVLQTAEAFFLLDAIESSPCLTAEDKIMIQKKLITALPSDQQAYLPKMAGSSSSSTNSLVLLTIRTILSAIHQQIVISFLYFDYNLQKKKKYRKNGIRYKVFPQTIVSDRGKFYCIGYSLEDNLLKTYRLDKMDVIHILDISFKMEQSFDLDSFMHNTFHMYSSKATSILAKFDISLLPVVYDNFGLDILITQSDETSFTAGISTAITPEVIGWFLKNSAHCTVYKPQQLKDNMVATARIILQKYKEEDTDEYY